MSPRRVLVLLSILGVIASLAVAVVSAEGVTRGLIVTKAVSGKPLVFNGPGPRGADAVLQRRDHGHWLREGRARVDRDGRYTVRTRATLGREHFRVLVDGRPSRIVTVNPAPAVKRVDDGYVVSGLLPSSLKRSVVLQRRVGDQWKGIVARLAGRKFRLTWTPGDATIVRVVAPQTVRMTGPRNHRKRTVYPAVASAAVRLSTPSDGHVTPTDPGTPTPTDPGTPTPTDPGTPTPTDPGTPTPTDPGTPTPTEPTPTEPAPTEPTEPPGPDPISYTDLNPLEAMGNTEPHLSSDGRYVAFLSNALLSVDDENNAFDVYVRDRETGTTELVSKNETTGKAVGANDPAISGDGRYVAYTSASPVLAGASAQTAGDVYLYDRAMGTTWLVSEALAGGGTSGNSDSYGPVVSFHGEYVAFTSEATNLASVSDNNNRSDVFQRDMAFGITTLVSTTDADDSVAGDAASWRPSMSEDGSRIAYQSLAQDLAPNAVPDVIQVYVWDQGDQHSEPVSLLDDHADLADGSCDRPSISADGTAVAFVSIATNLGLTNPTHKRQVYLWREADNSTTPISTTDAVGGNWHSDIPMVSGDGQRVAFVTAASNLAPGITSAVTSVLVWDATTGLRAVSVNTTGGTADGDSTWPSFDHSGHTLAFASQAGDIVPGEGVHGVDHIVLATLP